MEPNDRHLTEDFWAAMASGKLRSIFFLGGCTACTSLDDPIRKHILSALIELTGLETSKYILNLKSRHEVERKMCYGVKEVSGKKQG